MLTSDSGIPVFFMLQLFNAYFSFVYNILQLVLHKLSSIFFFFLQLLHFLQVFIDPFNMVAASALTIMMNEMFTAEKGDRDGVPNFGIVITDGKSGNHNATVIAAQAAHDSDILLLSVGVGDDVDVLELLDIASSPSDKYMFTAANYSQLVEVQSEFLQRTCTGGLV